MLLEEVQGDLQAGARLTSAPDPVAEAEAAISRSAGQLSDHGMALPINKNKNPALLLDC